MDSSYRPALHRQLDETGDALRPGVSPAGASFWKEGGGPRRGWESVAGSPQSPPPPASCLLLPASEKTRTTW